MVSSSSNSIGSDCITGLNSVHFHSRHDDLDSFDESIPSLGSVATGGNVTMDDIEMPAGGLLNLASVGGDPGGGGDGDSSGMPDHWSVAGTSSGGEGGGGGGTRHPSHRVRGSRGRGIMRSSLDSIDDDAEFPPGESRHARFAVTSLTGGAGSVDGTGFWSSDDSCTSSHLWDQMEESSHKTTNSSPRPSISDKQKQDKRRKLFTRRYAKAMVGLVALAALSISIVYLVSTGGYESLIEFLEEEHSGGPHSGGLFAGDDDDASEEQKEQLRHLRSPQSNREDMVPDPPEDGGNGDRDGEISPQERNQMARAWRILARERRLERRLGDMIPDPPEDRSNDGMVP